MRKRITKVLAIACIFTLLVGTMAYFTDRVSHTTTATVGNIDLVFTDQSLADEGYGVKDDVGTHSDTKPQAVNNVWTGGKLLTATGVLNPGDVIDMDYKVANTGTKSIDVKQTIVLTSNVAIPAEELTITVGGQDITPTPGGSAPSFTYTYNLAEIILSGSAELDGTSTEQAYEVALEFDRLAENAFMGASVTVNLDIYAKQHRNTTADDWDLIAQYQTIN